MPSRFVRFDPETVSLLDRCLEGALRGAATLGVETASTDTRNRLASALIEVAKTGERQEDALIDFALQALPAYRSGSRRANRSAATSRQRPA